MDICGELRGVPHHQRFLIVAYDLYSKWPEAVSTAEVANLSIAIDVSISETFPVDLQNNFRNTDLRLIHERGGFLN